MKRVVEGLIKIRASEAGRGWGFPKKVYGDHVRIRKEDLKKVIQIKTTRRVGKGERRWWWRSRG